MKISQKHSVWILAGLTLIVAAVCCMLPRIAQPQWYHLFADQRSLLGIPNFDDVVSDVPFAVLGVWGLAFVVRHRNGERVFIDAREAWPFLFVFTGLLLTAFGSSYYHWAPDNARLVWDRLPLTMTFMSMVAAVIAERIDVRLGVRLLPLLVAVGLSSALQWRWSEMHGAGDMRFCAAVQAYSALVILVGMFMPPRYTRGSDFGIVLGFYALAKALEFLDKPIYAVLGGAISGHTLKHLAAAAAGYWILRMLQKRQPVAVTSPMQMGVGV